eukprot:684570-Amphidinium_carterae.1
MLSWTKGIKIARQSKTRCHDHYMVLHELPSWPSTPGLCKVVAAAVEVSWSAFPAGHSGCVRHKYLSKTCTRDSRERAQHRDQAAAVVTVLDPGPQCGGVQALVTEGALQEDLTQGMHGCCS